MLPLAMILHGRGIMVSGSDRSHDQGRTPEKFAWLERQGIKIVPQDGEGLTKEFEALIVSSAIEDSIPEVKEAKELNIPILKRADLLARLFNGAKRRIAVAGTSGKSTTTGMLAWILSQAGKNPTVMNGANFLNFVSESTPFASALVGDPDMFVAECDESDGSIILYHPTTAILTNIALDHKPVSELVPVFRQYLSQSQRQILNLGNDTIARLIHPDFPDAFTFGIDHPSARLWAGNYSPQQTGSRTEIIDRKTGEKGSLTLQVSGRHNLENALAAISAASLEGVPLETSLAALQNFKGVGRRLENIGIYNNISIIDDFAHNPDKVRATLSTLAEHNGRLLVMFQMHGFGPLRLMKDELRDAFLSGLKAGDRLYMPEVLYLGGTVDRSYTARDFINEINERGGEKGITGEWFETRSEILPSLLDTAKSGDRIIVMGARDDTLATFAHDILEKLRHA